MESKSTDTGALRITCAADMPYNYHAGFYYSRFLRELKDNKRIVGVRCPRCKKIYVPPRVV